MAGRIIMRAAYGITIEKENDRYVEIAEHSLQAMCATVNGGFYLVDSVPIRKSYIIYTPYPDAHINSDMHQSQVSAKVVPGC